MNRELLAFKPNKIKNDEIKYIYEKNKAIIIYPKKFTKLEKWIQNKIGGSEEIKRPLDKFTTFIWEKCNGKNSIAQIIRKFDEKFGEEVAPADVKVQKFIKRLLELNLIEMEI